MCVVSNVIISTNYFGLCLLSPFYNFLIIGLKVIQNSTFFSVIDSEIQTIHNKRFIPKAIIGNQNEIAVAME